MKYDFKKVEVLDVTGNPVLVQGKPVKVNETIGNIIYTDADDIRMSDNGKEIYNGKEVDLNDDEIKKVEDIVKKSLLPLFKRAVIKYIEEVKVKKK